MFKLDMSNFKGAVVSAALTGVIAVGMYITGVGDVFALDWRMTLNVFVMAAISAGLASLGKNLVTDKDGKVLGVQVK